MVYSTLKSCYLLFILVLALIPYTTYLLLSLLLEVILTGPWATIGILDFEVLLLVAFTCTSSDPIYYILAIYTFTRSNTHWSLGLQKDIKATPVPVYTICDFKETKINCDFDKNSKQKKH